MESFITKYRPTKFSEYVGQKSAVNILKKIAMSDGIACRAIYLKGPWGSGKCVLGDTRVATSDGYVKIKTLMDAKDGFSDYLTDVVSRDGVFKSSKFYKQSRVNGFRLHLDNGFTVNGTVEHKVLSMIDGKIELHSMGSLSFNKSAVLFPKKPIDLIWQKCPHAYLLGKLAATSVIEGDYLICVSSDFKDDIKNILIPDSSVFISHSSTCTKVLLTDLIYNLSDLERSVPEIIFSSDLESRIAFIQGCIDYSGTSTFEGIKFSSLHKEFLQSLQELFQTLGFSPLLIDDELILPYSQYNDVVRLEKNGKPYAFSIEDSKYNNHYPISEEQYFELQKFILSEDSDFSYGSYFQDFLISLKEDYIISDFWIHEVLRAFGSSDKTPSFLSEFLKYNSSLVKSTSYFYNAVVYDLSVPVTHEFYCQGTFNHNTTAARLFGKAMNCSSFKITGDVCNECEGCKEVMRKNSSLYYEFDTSATGSVDAIRNLTSLFEVKAQGRRVVVFDEIHSASKQALNALLKIVEEGIPDTIFIFATTEEILPTLKSRCLPVEITKIPFVDIKNFIDVTAKSSGLQLSPITLDSIALKADGHMRDALSLLQLVSIGGEDTLKSPYKIIQKFIYTAIKHEDTTSLENELLSFPVTEIKDNLLLLLKRIFLKEGKFETALNDKGFHKKLFSYLLNPVSWNAMNDENTFKLLLLDLKTIL